MMYTGMMSAMAGSMRSTSSSVLSSPPPKRQRAIEYAVGRLTTSAAAMLSDEMTRLLVK